VACSACSERGAGSGADRKARPANRFASACFVSKREVSAARVVSKDREVASFISAMNVIRATDARESSLPLPEADFPIA
jgi:hypothetical protein